MGDEAALSRALATPGRGLPRLREARAPLALVDVLLASNCPGDGAATRLLAHVEHATARTPARGRVPAPRWARCAPTRRAGSPTGSPDLLPQVIARLEDAGARVARRLSVPDARGGGGRWTRRGPRLTHARRRARPARDLARAAPHAAHVFVADVGAEDVGAAVEARVAGASQLWIWADGATETLRAAVAAALELLASGAVDAVDVIGDAAELTAARGGPAASARVRAGHARGRGRRDEAARAGARAAGLARRAGGWTRTCFAPADGLADDLGDGLADDLGDGLADDLGDGLADDLGDGYVPFDAPPTYAPFDDSYVPFEETREPLGGSGARRGVVALRVLYGRRTPEDPRGPRCRSVRAEQARIQGAKRHGGTATSGGGSAQSGREARRARHRPREIQEGELHACIYAHVGNPCENAAEHGARKVETPRVCSPCCSNSSGVPRRWVSDPGGCSSLGDAVAREDVAVLFESALDAEDQTQFSRECLIASSNRVCIPVSVRWYFFFLRGTTQLETRVVHGGRDGEWTKLATRIHLHKVDQTAGRGTSGFHKRFPERRAWLLRVRLRQICGTRTSLTGWNEYLPNGNVSGGRVPHFHPGKDHPRC